MSREQIGYCIVSDTGLPIIDQARLPIFWRKEIAEDKRVNFFRGKDKGAIMKVRILFDNPS